MRAPAGPPPLSSRLPPVLQLLRREAPGVGLYSLAADLAVVVRSPELPRVMGSTLFQEEFACMVRKDHPEVGEELDLATFVRLGHALMSPQGSGPTVVDTALGQQGKSRRIVLKIAYFLAAPLLVAQSDLILTAPRRLAERFAEMAPLRILKPPLSLPDFPVRMLWPERLQQDPAHRWLREAMRRGILG